MRDSRKLAQYTGSDSAAESVNDVLPSASRETEAEAEAKAKARPRHKLHLVTMGMPGLNVVTVIGLALSMCQLGPALGGGPYVGRTGLIPSVRLETVF